MRVLLWVLLPLLVVQCVPAERVDDGTAEDVEPSAGPEGTSEVREIDWDVIPAEALANMAFLEVDPGVVEHPYEKRGFVSVPFDYSDPDGRQLEIFYRLMPSNGSTGSDSVNPILVVMNGGPGAPSSIYRSLDHDYEGENDSDAFDELAKHFRVLAVDQRGTGNSAPLDLDDPALSPEVIAKFFDSDEHARDHGQVIEAIVPAGEPFFILARSYGGEIGFKYLTVDSDLPQPTGMIFSSAILPRSDGLDTFLERRRKQLELNREWLTAVPEIDSKLEQLRAQLEYLEFDPETVNYLWSELGAGVGWEAELEARVDELLAIDDSAQMEAAFAHGIQESVNPLNYVLSSAALIPGYTDRTMTIETSHQVPFESWMLDENWTLNQIGRDGTWRQAFVASVDAKPPPPIAFPPDDEIREALGRTQSLFTFGKSDAFLAQELQLERAKQYDVPGHTEFIVFEGGHGAAFSAEGAAVIAEWAARQQPARSPELGGVRLGAENSTDSG